MQSFPVHALPVSISDMAALFDQLPGLVYRCRLDPDRNLHGELVFAGAGAEGLIGRPTTDLIGTPLAAIIFTGDQEQVTAAIDRAIQDDGTYTCTFRVELPDGNLRWVRDTGRVQEDEHGLWLNGYLADATAQVRRQQYLERQAVRRTRRLAALYDVMELAGTLHHPRTAMQQAVVRVMAVIRAEVGMVHLLDPVGETLHLIAQQGLPEPVGAAISLVDRRTSPFAAVLVEQEPIRAAADSLPLGLAEISTGEFVGVPILASETSRGVLSILVAGSGRLSLEEQDLLVSVGEQMGVWIEYTRLRRKADELLVMQERNRLARELHDSVTQSLYSVTLFAEAGRRLVQAGNTQEALRTIQRVNETGRQALKEMRLLVHKLRPSILVQEGLVRALQNRLNAVEGRAGVHHELVADELPDLSPDVEEALFHIAQEALNNALKHGGGDQVWVRLWVDDSMVNLEVEDDGRGFDPQTADKGHGFGLTSMRERAEMLSGEVRILAQEGQGTLVNARLPARSQAEPMDLADTLW